MAFQATEHLTMRYRQCHVSQGGRHKFSSKAFFSYSH